MAHSIDVSYCWHSFYLNLGFDLIYFNYRGYGRSEGVPTPDRLKSDAEYVLKHFKANKSISNLIIHGESLGGMVACSLAKSNKIKLLVCDRTFASLDSVAARLMGTWAEIGIRYLGHWYTNSVTDYLKADCRKVILQVRYTTTMYYLHNRFYAMLCYVMLCSFLLNINRIQTMKLSHIQQPYAPVFLLI